MSIPILLVCFNRPETLFKVLVSLRGLDNPIYVWVDGSVSEKDQELANECVRLIRHETSLNVIEIRRNDTNYSNSRSIPSAIDWVFEFVNQVVIIEDDVLLSREFFRFAEFALELHKYNKKVVGVSALNAVPKKFINDPEKPFRYSVYASVWGWAINQRSWPEIRELLLFQIPEVKSFPMSARNFAARKRWRDHLSGVSQNSKVSWDYRFQLALFSLEGYFVVPNINYALNVGFGYAATNTRNRPDWVPNEYGQSVYFDSSLPSHVVQDVKADNWVAKYMHHTKNYYLLKTVFRQLIILNYRSKSH